MSRLYITEKGKVSPNFTLNALLSAFLCALPFTCPYLFVTAWVGLVPLFTAITNEKFMKLSRRRAFGVGYLYGLFCLGMIYYWFLRLYPLDFAGLSHAASAGVVLLAWLGISAFQALTFGLGTAIYRIIGKRRPLLLALIFTLCEFAWQFGTLALPWCKISVTQYKCLPFIQCASLGGSLLVSFVIYAINALLALRKRGKKYVIAAAVLFAANMIYGAVSLNMPSDYTDTASFALIQGNISSASKWHTTATELFNKFRDLSLEAAEKEHPDYIVWPESAVPVALDSAFKSDFVQIPHKTDGNFIVGAFGKKDGKTTNSVYLITEDGISDTHYSKRHLVPFGEYLPWRGVFEKLLPSLTQINMLSDDLVAGTESAVIQTEHGKIGALVCFDSIFPDLARESVRDGAEMLVIVTNDSWYYDSAATSQHAAQSVFRAVENGRCVARCANTGISMLIDEKGRVKDSLRAMKRGYICDELGFGDKTTLYSVTGDTWLHLGTLYVAILTVIGIIKSRRIKKWKSKPSTSDKTTPT